MDCDSGAGSSISNGELVVNIRVIIQYVRKDEKERCLQFDPEDSVWTVKQTLLASMKTEIVESFNYGLFFPPVKGRAGKFLDEDRCMKDYGLTDSTGVLEFKYRSRVYKDLHPGAMRKDKLAHMASKEVHTKLLSKIMKGQVDRVKKLTDKGVDPNFIDYESGETPLTLSVRLADPKPMMLALIEGGAHIEFRNSQSFTALHCASQLCRPNAIKALLELGSSTNYQDVRGLTPLYHCVLVKDDLTIMECLDLLLYDHAATEVVDQKGWTPLHQVCRNGRVQIVDKLIFYGADINAINGNGNTPLHICAINNQEECARILLFRGAIKDIQNHSEFDASFMASKAGNEKLVELINNFQPQDAVPYTEVPQRNPRRRTIPWVGSNGTLPRPRTIADIGSSRVSLISSGLVGNSQTLTSSIQGNVVNPQDTGINRSVTNKSFTKQNSVPSDLAYANTYANANIVRKQQPLNVTGSSDIYANLDSFTTSATVTNLPVASASTSEWKNSQTTEMKLSVADDSANDVYENLPMANSASFTNPTPSPSKPFVVSTSLYQNEQRKPIPPLSSMKLKRTGEAADDAGSCCSSNSRRSSIVSGTGSVSSAESLSHIGTRLQMPTFNQSGSPDDEQIISLDEKIRREIQRRKRTSGIITDVPKSSDDHSDGGLGSSIHSSTDNAIVNDPPPPPAWIPPPPPLATTVQPPPPPPSGVDQLQRLKSTNSSTDASLQRQQSTGISFADESFKELLARKAENRSMNDPVTERRNSSTVNSSGPLVTLKRTSFVRGQSEEGFEANDSAPAPLSINQKPPPPAIKQKSVKPQLTRLSDDQLSSSSSLSNKQPPSSSVSAMTNLGSNLRTRPESNGFKWQMEVRESSSRTPLAPSASVPFADVDDIDSMIMPPPPADFSANVNANQSTANSYQVSQSTSLPPNAITPEKVTFFVPPSDTQEPSQFTANTPSVNRGSKTQPQTQSKPFQSPTILPSPPPNFASSPSKPTAVNAGSSAPAPATSVQKSAAVPRKTQPPPPPRRGPPTLERTTSAIENAADEIISPPSAFVESTVPAHKRREVAAAVAMQRRSANGLKTPSAGSTETNRKSLSSAMSDWSHVDVQNWLESIQMSKHRPMFQSAGVDGRKLIAMTDDELFNLGVREPGQRLMLGRAIKIALAND